MSGVVISLLVQFSMPFELWLDRRAGPGRMPSASATPKDLFDRNLVAAAPSGNAVLVTADGSLMDGEELLGATVCVDSPDDQDDAVSLIGSVPFIFIERCQQPMITAENLLAASRGTGTRLAVRCSNASQVNGLAFALELGVDALVVSAESLDAGLLDALAIAKAQRLERAATDVGDDGDQLSVHSSCGSPMIQLTEARVTSAMSGGVGDRVCLDLTQLLFEGEGCLVGSSAMKLVLVLGETVSSGYVPPRPFRINAGPVHQYVLLADGSTKYLSEVVAGDELLCVRASDGRGRAGVVGRCKVEPRPMLKIEFACGEGTSSSAEGDGIARGQLFLQQAETVRLASTTAGGLPVTRVRSETDAHVLVRIVDQGTHVGRTINAQVTER